jgi:hypothetical protein
MLRIDDFELIDHGIEHPQYFQGCGVAFTSFENVVTGIGNNRDEAIDDCLEQIAQSGFDTKNVEMSITEQEHQRTYYYVSIRWNEERGQNETNS